MGAEPWSSSIAFEPSVERALEKLRQRVFAEGDFRGSELDPATPEEALENMDADGTCSILDIAGVSDEPEFCAACPLSDEQLRALFGTTEPTKLMVESNQDFYEDIDRGQAIYIVVYDNGKPAEYFFAGYSFD